MKDKTNKQLLDELINTNVFDVLGDALSIQDTDFKILYQNIIAKDMIGDHTGEFCYKAYESRDSICPDCSLSKSFKDGKVHREERDNPSKNGSLHVEITSSPLKDPKGRIFAGMEIVRNITERKKAEERIEQINESYERLTDNADEAIFKVKIEEEGGRVVYQNPAAERIFGYTQADWNSDPAFGFKVIHSDYAEKHGQIIKDITTSKKTIKNAVLGWIAKDGREVIMEYTIIPIIDENGELAYFESIGKDITARKEAEQELQKAKNELEIKVKERTAELENTVAHLSDEINERNRIENSLVTSEARYRGLFENSPISLWEEDYSEVRTYIDTLRSSGVKDFREYFKKHPESVIDCAGKVKVLDINKATITLYKAKNKKEFMAGLKGILTEDTIRTFTEVLITIAGDKTRFEAETINQTLTGDRKNINLKWIVAPGHEKTYSKILISIVDITERKKAAERYQTLFEKASDGIFYLTASGKIVEVNQSFARLHGYSMEEILDMSLDMLDTPESLKLYPERIRRILSGETLTFEVEHYHKDGHIIPFEVVAKLMTIGPEQLIIAFHRDITERKKMEQVIINSESKLKKQKTALENKNIALKELIKHVDVEKNKLKEDISINVDKTLMPIIAELETCEDPQKYVGLLKLHLEEIQSSFGRNIAGENYNLTAREIEICNMIKGGARSKDICKLLNISYETVEKHRKNIRKKLGISNKKVNLFYFLQKL